MKHLARPAGDSMRWIVTSASRPEIEHLVQLDAFGGIGECSCEHFQFRIAPDLREGRRAGATRCTHITVAREAYTDAMIQYTTRMREQREAAAGPRECETCSNQAEPGRVTCLRCREQFEQQDEQ